MFLKNYHNKRGEKRKPSFFSYIKFYKFILSQFYFFIIILLLFTPMQRRSFLDEYYLDTLSLGTRRSRTKLEKTSLSANVSLRSYTVFIQKTTMPLANDTIRTVTQMCFQTSSKTKKSIYFAHCEETISFG